MSEVKIFLENMFDYFREKCKNDRFKCFRYLDYNLDYSYRFASFLSKMDCCVYDVKNARIRLTARIGNVYCLNDLLKFNEENKDYISIIGVGNSINSVHYRESGAEILFELNKDYFKEDILEIQKAVKLIELIDTFDVYPIDIIEKRVLKVVKRNKLEEITLIGDYAKVTATKDSTIDFIADKSKLRGLNNFIFENEINMYFKCEANVYDVKDEVDDSDKIVFSIKE